MKAHLLRIYWSFIIKRHKYTKQLLISQSAFDPLAMFSSLPQKCWDWRKHLRRAGRPCKTFGLMGQPHAVPVLPFCFYQLVVRWDAWDSDGSKGWGEWQRQGDWLWSMPESWGKKKSNCVRLPFRHVVISLSLCWLRVMVPSQPEVAEQVLEGTEDRRAMSKQGHGLKSRCWEKGHSMTDNPGSVSILP